MNIQGQGIQMLEQYRETQRDTTENSITPYLQAVMVLFARALCMLSITSCIGV